MKILKNIMKIYCFETVKDWIYCTRLQLLAVRESEQESLVFSPFELVFGHSVRGPHSVAQKEVTVQYE